MKIEQREGKIFNLKPEMTTAMKLAASFAITYYGLLLVFAVITVVFSQYYIDSYYFNESSLEQDRSELLTPILQLVILITLVFSLIQIFRKKIHGKAIFVVASIIFIVFQLITTGFDPWMKYALEVLMVLIIAPIRVKKKIKVKDGKLKIETVEQPSTEPADITSEVQTEEIQENPTEVQTEKTTED